ncbi:MAG: 30S ribosomal protein S13 [Parcubacteria group bacterium GW2011_GWA2_44_12]|nr:MAG: 30S ribosomal protein S13 [Parcubacteria group bacterium GW2011_GWA2_44_12]
MARIAGVNLPSKKRIEIALTYIFGIGITSARKILQQAQVDPSVKVSELSEVHENKLREIIEKNYKVEGNLKREIISNIKRLKEIAAYRGTRHARNLPVRGQRTKTNSRTAHGNVRKTATSGKKASAQKT